MLRYALKCSELAGAQRPNAARPRWARQLHPTFGCLQWVRALRARGILPSGVMNENFSLIVMCLFLLGSLAFLAQQLTSYH